MCLSVGRCRLPAGVSLGCEPAPLLWRPAAWAHGMVKRAHASQRSARVRGTVDSQRVLATVGKRSRVAAPMQAHRLTPSLHPLCCIPSCTACSSVVLQFICWLCEATSRRKSFCQKRRRSRTARSRHMPAGTQPGHSRDTGRGNDTYVGEKRIRWRPRAKQHIKYVHANHEDTAQERA